MKLLHFYLCLLVILLQTIFASSSSTGNASLKSKKSGSARPKKVVGKPAKQKKSTRVKKPQVKNSLKKKKRVGKNSNVKGIVAIKEDNPMLLIELLLKELVEIVIGYFNDDAYPIIVSTHNWLLENVCGVEVDSARVYLRTDLEGVKGLNHSLANIKDDERRLIEFGDPEWSEYDWFSSSPDGRYVSFSHKCKPSIDLGGLPNRGTKWFTQSSDAEDGRLRRIAFDGEDSNRGILSRDGQTLCAYSHGVHPITRVYRVREEAGKDPIGFIKFELDGEVRAVSSNYVIVQKKTAQFEIHDIGKDPSRLACQIDVSVFVYVYALKKDGSEAAFVIGSELRIMDVNSVSGSAIDQPAIVKAQVPELLGVIYQLVYDDGGKLHARHATNKVSLFDPLTRELILLEALQDGQKAIHSAISSNANHIAFLRYVGEGENGKYIYETIVKRRFNDADFEDSFGYEADKKKQAAKP